ncbi:hypothetical protein [Desulforamulus reducens]|uniref:hypothetical protein n=1 Tax=Desulforamulus reducens TaxID=59610 RepID=UPI0002E65168|nr:hypothetical protein [Desulforamulus reducens]
MKKTKQVKTSEEIVGMLKEASSAAEQLAKTKKLRNTVKSMIDKNDNSIIEALRGLLKQPPK